MMHVLSRVVMVPSYPFKVLYSDSPSSRRWCWLMVCILIWPPSLVVMASLIRSMVSILYSERSVLNVFISAIDIFGGDGTDPCHCHSYSAVSAVIAAHVRSSVIYLTVQAFGSLAVISLTVFVVELMDMWCFFPVSHVLALTMSIISSGTFVFHCGLVMYVHDDSYCFRSMMASSIMVCIGLSFVILDRVPP